MIGNTKLSLIILVLLVWFFIGCANVFFTHVSSISNQKIPQASSFHVMPGNDSIESKKIVKIIKNQLQIKGYRPEKLEDADIIISFSAEMRAEKKLGTRNIPIYSEDPSSGFNILVGYESSSYNYTEHPGEVRVRFHDGKKFRAKEKKTILWEAVGKSSGKEGDIIRVAPKIIASIFEEIGKDSDSKLYKVGEDGAPHEAK
jgi:hypothetical protein